MHRAPSLRLLSALLRPPLRGPRPLLPAVMEPASQSPKAGLHSVPLDPAAFLPAASSKAESAGPAEAPEEPAPSDTPRPSDTARPSSSEDEAGPSEDDWKPIAPEIVMVQRLMNEGVPPMEILNEIAPGLRVEGEVRDEVLWRLIVQLLSEPPPRPKLPQHNSLEDAVELIRSSSRIIVLTGAGISVSCGIPDFRSKEGIYSRLHVDFPDLPDPQSMFDIHYFRRNPRPFFQFAKEIYPGQFEPSLSHRFIRLLETQGKLLRNYTQNIDTLEQVAGIEKTVQCHGSFSTATCCICKHKCQADDIREAIFRQEIPRCPKCPAEEQMGIMKPDIVFFGEDLPEHFHQQMSQDKDAVDLLIVIGSSLKVRPVALIPSSIPPEVPQILIDRQPLSHLRFDIQLLGYCDGIVDELLWRLEEPWRGHCSPAKTAPCRVLSQLPPFPAEPSPTSLCSQLGPDAPSPDGEPGEKRARPDQAEEAGEQVAERPEPRNLGLLLQPDSLYYQEGKARTLFHGSVLYEEEEETESESSTPSSAPSPVPETPHSPAPPSSASPSASEQPPQPPQ